MLKYFILVKHAVVMISCDLSLGPIVRKFLIQIKIGSRFASHLPTKQIINYNTTMQHKVNLRQNSVCSEQQ